ncbi:DUF5996 family protein [Microbacterium sp. Bi128]|uniref:DUF5996 family protein n=1 Tax=Microbacterium sp. Bi128 TaxID=2821115 RepID=UPI001E42EEED|nr:DUF5996 family protein [Microbacterium sp. Bi128]
MWTQIVGKIRIAHTPMLNHWWQVTLYLTPRGLTTSSIPDRHDAFDMEFEFSEHVLRLDTGNGMSANVNLSPKPVAEFHGETFDAMNRSAGRAFRSMTRTSPLTQSGMARRWATGPTAWDRSLGSPRS